MYSGLPGPRKSAHAHTHTHTTPRHRLFDSCGIGGGTRWPLLGTCAWDGSINLAKVWRIINKNQSRLAGSRFVTSERGRKRERERKRNEFCIGHWVGPKCDDNARLFLKLLFNLQKCSWSHCHSINKKTRNAPQTTPVFLFRNTIWQQTFSHYIANTTHQVIQVPFISVCLDEYFIMILNTLTHSLSLSLLLSVSLSVPPCHRHLMKVLLADSEALIKAFAPKWRCVSARPPRPSNGPRARWRG